MQGIGQLLWKLREKEGIRQKQLCLGISSVSKYARMEADQQEIDFFLIDRIMGRLGKSVERLTYILPRDIYNIYELRQEIQQKICQKKWEEAKQCLLEYEKNKRAKEPLHQQFIEQEYAQIAWLRGKSVETVCEHLEKAIVQTMPEAEIQRKTGILSAEEYKLLLFRWEVCFGTDRERGEKELQELVEEIFQKNFERTERVKVIPYAALLIEKTARDGKADTYLKLITETALENLREEGKLLYMPEILEQYAQILEKENSNAEFIGLLRQERASLLELESDYKVSFKNYRLFDHVVRNFEIDAELIRRTRNAAKLTQEGLSEDICAQETLARIENGNQKPRSGNLRQMMEKMGRSGDRIETGIQVEEYETLELKIEFSKFIHRKEYGNAEKVLSKIEEKLDCNLMKNYQYIETERVKVKYKENAEYTEQFIKQLKELLAMSLKVENCASHSRYFSDELDAQNFYQKEEQMFDIFLCIWYTIFMKKDMFTINKNGLSYGRGYVYSLQYHLVWCTKYRKKVLKDGIDVECKEMLESLAQEYKFQILAMEVMPDHIHLLVDCRPQFYISDMIKIMKGNLARQMFLLHPELKKELWGGHLWNPSYCAVTVSDRSREQVLAYIEGQKEKSR